MTRTSTPSAARRCLLPGIIVGIALSVSSCRLPPREAWNQVQQHGLIPVLFDSPANPAPSLNQIAAVPATPAPVSTPAAVIAVPPTPPLPVKPAQIARIPFATPVPGRSGYVFSPHRQDRKVIDVRDYAAGAEVRCPYTLQPFMVPDFSAMTAARSPDPRPADLPVAEVASRAAHLSLVDPQETLPLSVSLPDPGQSAPAPVLPSLPYGSRIPGRPGYVNSPFAEANQLVDVAGIAPGVEVKCPYSGKLFRVPAYLPEEIVPPPATGTLPPAAPGELMIPETDAAPPVPAPDSPPPPAPAAAGASPSTAPTAAWADEAKTRVRSPFGVPGQEIDVTDHPAGSRMTCPFSGKEFVVPAA